MDGNSGTKRAAGGDDTPSEVARPARGGRGLLVAGTVAAGLALAVIGAHAGAGAWVENGFAATSTSPDEPGAVHEVPDTRAAPAELPALELADGTPAAVRPGPMPDASALQTRIAAIPGDEVGGQQVGAVLDPGTGEVLVDHRASAPMIPASTMKVVTAGAALHALGGEHTFTTSTVLLRDGDLVLVGGGDPYLATGGQAAADPQRTDLDDLARSTAHGLQRRGLSAVALRGDASLFDGPGRSPTWPATYGDQATPVSSLVVDQGRLSGVSPGPRTETPAQDAVARFAEALQDQGIDVRVDGMVEEPRQVAAAVQADALPGGHEVVAEVESAPLSAIVEDLLVHSDNDAAEIIAHHVGLATGHGGSFEGGAAGIRQVLEERGVDTTGLVLHDGSGLSRDNRLTAAALGQVLAWGVQEEGFRPMLTGLPVGAASGTLTPRFATDGTEAGRGTVRAKTGTLRGTSGLAGYGRTASGGVVTYAFLVNDATNDQQAQVWLDRATAAVIAAD